MSRFVEDGIITYSIDYSLIVENRDLFAETNTSAVTSFFSSIISFLGVFDAFIPVKKCFKLYYFT